MAKLGDICTIQSGGTPSRSNKDYWDNGTIPWVKISDFSGKYLSYTSERITQAGLNGSSAKIFPKGTILYTIFATLGETCILDIDATTNQAIAGLKLNNDSVSLDYLYYYLLSKKEYVNEIGRGVAQNNINMKILREMEITIPSKEEQDKITAVLNKVYELIALRKEQLVKLDQLVKSRFIELFGDYRINNKGFSCKKGSELFKFSSGKFLPEEKRIASGIPAYGGNGIAWYTDKPLVTFPTVIIGRVGAQCGNIHAVTTPVWITDNAIYIKEQKTTAYTLEFLAELMKMMDLYQYADFSGQPKITQKPLETLEYIMPPIERQKEYTAFVKQTEKSKLAIQQSLDKLELLKKSLMQEYFG